MALLGPTLATLPAALLLHTAALIALVALVLPAQEGARLLDRPLLLLGGAFALRLLFIPSTPDLSVDPFRYLWDGWLHAGGINPYRHTPSDPVLAGRQADPLFAAMNSRDFHSISPPLSQWLFLPAGALHERLGWPGSWLVLKGTITAIEFAGVVLLHGALRRFALPPRLLALYAWNPLVLVTVAGVGHSEGGMIAGIGLLALGLAAHRPALAWAGLALATLSKLVPLLVAPLLLRHHLARHGPRRTLVALALGALPALLLTAPFVFPGLLEHLRGSASLYLTLFQFNAGIHALLGALLGPAQAGLLLAGLFLALATLIWLRYPASTPRSVLAGGLLLMGAYLATATTIHPWYLLWGLVLVPFVSRHRSAWLWASGAGFATYLAYTGVPEAPLAALFWLGAAAFVIREEAPRARDLLLRPAGRRKARQIEPWIEGTRILDLGAGEGWVGHAIADTPEGAHARTARRVVLADIDPRPAIDLPTVRTEPDRLPFPDRSFDTVLLSLVLHHARDPDALLAEALRLARHRVIVTESTWRHRWELALLTLADRTVNRGRGAGPMATAEEPLHFDTPEGWKARATRLGARVLVSRRLNRIGHRHHVFVLEPTSAP